MTIDDRMKVLGCTFQNIQLLEEALTHRSYLNEHRSGAKNHNERLEFLGDAVLELLSTEFLFTKFPQKPEGELTAFRAALVNTQTLAGVGERMGLNQILFLSKGEAKDTGRARQIILANAFEAILGALFLDQGLDAVRALLHRELFPLIDSIVSERTWQDAKSRLQEIAQEKRGITPHYTTVSQKGPDHDRVFSVGVYFKENEIARGEGKSKQEAEQEAAKVALQKMKWS